MKGELIGINEAKSSYSSSGVTVDGVGFAISIDKAEPILEELMSRETKEAVSEEEAGYLGVTCADVTEEIAANYNMPEGVCFTSVLEGSPADKAGAKKGDVLVAFDGEEINDYDDLKETIQYYSAGTTVEITVMRSNDGEYSELVLEVKLADYDTIQSLQAQG